MYYFIYLTIHLIYVKKQLSQHQFQFIRVIGKEERKKRISKVGKVYVLGLRS